MTALLLAVLAILALYAVYFAARVARLDAPPAAFMDGGQAIPGWAAMFALPGLALATLGVERHLLLVSHYGLQASHVAVGLVLFALAALLLWNRMWYVTRVAGLATPGEALGRFYGSVTLRIVMLGLALLFALPFSANILSFTALTLEGATGGIITHSAAVWLIALSLAIPAIIGGWRALIYTVAMQSVLLVLLIAGAVPFAEVVLTAPGFPAVPIPVAEGVLWDRLPGVVRYAAGLAKGEPVEGIFTSVAVASSALALLGAVCSPAMLYLGQTMQGGRGLGVSAVWLTAGLGAGLLVLAGPMLATRIAGEPLAFAVSLHQIAPLAGVSAVLLGLIGGLVAVHFFVTGGTILIVRELLLTYLFPDFSPTAQRLTARIALGVAFFGVALMASFMPLISAILASVALPLAVQLLPALLGLTILRWVSRGAILAGLTLGMLIVVFTEPLGLILFEGLFVELPWGRWPLTIHSAAWGLVFNLVLVFLSAAVTLRSADRFERDRLHDALYQATGVQVGDRGLFWAMMLVWGWLACGPGAVLGNTFFSDPIFTQQPATLGIPSLWVWQILFWLFGVVLVWWLAYRVGLGQMSTDRIKPIRLGNAPSGRTPDWLAAGLARIRVRGG